MFLDNNKKIDINNSKFWLKEKKFWDSYGKIYMHLEVGAPYEQMLNAIRDIIIDKDYSIWLDAGCGPGAMINLLLNNQKNIEKIIGIDFDKVMIDKATKRLKDYSNVELNSIDLSKKLPFEDNYFGGIIANLVLSYIIVFDDLDKKYSGNEALKCILLEMYRILKKDGIFVWTSPVENVNFFKVFLAGWKQVFNPLDPCIYYGPLILLYALQIQSKGKKGIYHFLNKESILSLMVDIGFKDIKIEKVFANQAYLISSKK